MSVPVPGLTSYAGQEEPQAETNKGIDSSNNPQRGRNGPGGLVEDSPDHSYDDNETEPSDGPYLSRRKDSPGHFDRAIPLSEFRLKTKWRIQSLPTLRILFAWTGHRRFTYIPRAIGTRSATRVIPEETHNSHELIQDRSNEPAKQLLRTCRLT